ncbi:MAG: calcium-binding protein [Pseudomonadota bacterium]
MSFPTRTLTVEQYEDLRFRFIRQIEAEHNQPYRDTNGFATIGIGFNINEQRILDTVLLQGFGVENDITREQYNNALHAAAAQATSTEDLRERLNATWRELTGNATAVFEIAPEFNAAGELERSADRINRDILNGLMDESIGGGSSFEDILKNRLAGYGITNLSDEHYSLERLVLLSLEFNNGNELFGEGLEAALREGNRFSVWYEIRYRTNGDNLDGIAKRRYMESALFGLFSSDTPTDDEAEQVVNAFMDSAHQARIQTYEQRWASNIVAANQDLQAIEYDESVPTIGEVLKPITGYLLERFAPTSDDIDLSSFADKIDGEVILGIKNSQGQIASSVKGDEKRDKSDLLIAVNDEDTVLSGRYGNDVLIAKGGDDTIYGGENDDVLLGQDGSDTLFGGTGYDQLYGGDKKDYLYAQGKTDREDTANDYLDGGAGDDELFGADGDNTLIGGKDNDILQGGKGNDTYIFNTGDGKDKIIDTEGSNQLVINKKVINRLQRLAPDSDIFVAVDANGHPIDNETRYVINDNQLTIHVGGSNTGDVIIIEQFNVANNAFGLTFLEPESEAEPINPEVAFTWDANNLQEVLGDAYNELTEYLDAFTRFFDTAWQEAQSIIYEADNDPYLGSDDTLFGGIGYPFEGSSANDRLVGSDAAPSTFFGMAGNDKIIGGNVTSEIFGGQGSDIISGGNSNDFLWGGYLATDFSYLLSRWGADDFADFEARNQALYDFTLAEQTERVGDNNIIAGGGGNDVISAGAFNDNASGQAGNDLLYGESGQDTLDGGAGNDFIYGDSRANRTTTANDQIAVFGEYLNAPAPLYDVNKDYDDTLSGGEGHDTLYGELGNDVISGGSGHDTLQGDRVYTYSAESAISDNSEFSTQAAFALSGNYHGDDTIIAGSGQDTVMGNGGHDTVYAGADNDFVLGDDHITEIAFHGDDTLHGEGGDDILAGGMGDDKLYGGDDNDTLYGDGEVIEQLGQPGQSLFAVQNNRNETQGGADYLEGGAGNDTIYAGAGDDEALGGEGDDIILGGHGNDTLSGGADDDFIQDYWGAKEGDINTLKGGDGNDILLSSLGSDRLFGGNDTDILKGGQGDDLLDGGSGDSDLLIGDEGQDTLMGGEGNDILYGGKDDDTYLFYYGDGIDYLRDEQGQSEVVIFESSEDVQVLSGGGVSIIRYGVDDYIITNTASFNKMALKLNDVMIGAADLQALSLQNASGIAEQLAAINAITVGSTAIEPLGLSSSDGLVNDAFSSDNLNRNLNVSLNNSSSEPASLVAWFSGQLIAIDATTPDISASNPLSWLQKGAQALTGPVSYFVDAEGELMAPIMDEQGNSQAPKGAVTEYILLTDGSLLSKAANFFDNDQFSVAPESTVDLPDGAEGDTSGLSPDDTIINGSASDDQLTGGTGNDLINTYDGADSIMSGEGNDIVFAGAGADEVEGGKGNDFLYGEAGDDELSGDDGDDFLQGGSGNDALSGGYGNDVLVGGAGNDRLDGGTGVNFFKFSAGHGADYIEHNKIGESHNHIIFAKDIDPAELTMQQVGHSSLVLRWGEDDRVTIENYFSNNVPASIRFEFDDTELTKAAVYKGVLIGTEESETITGFSGDDVLEGKGGADRLYGGAGDDTLIGGEGADILDGGSGKNTFIFSAGHGLDTIQLNTSLSHVNEVKFTSELEQNNARMSRFGDSLYIEWSNAPEDKLTINNYFVNPYIVNITFENDQTTLNQAAVREAVLLGSALDDRLEGHETDDVIQGFAGKDRIVDRKGFNTIYGGSEDDSIEASGKLYGEDGNDNLRGTADSDDELIGGTGDDSLQGSYGKDTYRFSQGDGVDRIIDNNHDDNIIIFDDSVVPDDVSLSRDEDDLIISYGIEDEILVQSFFDDEVLEKADINEIRFSDGESWSTQDILQKILVGDEQDNVLEGYESDDILIGGAGDDRLVGKGGDDILLGGAGDDTLSGGEGNDRYRINLREEGQDTIGDSSGIDVLELMDVNPNDVILRRSGLHLIIFDAASESQAYQQRKIQINYYYDNYDPLSARIDSIEFANGDIWNSSDIEAAVLMATDADDIIRGFDSDDIIYGLAGHDKLNGDGGEDTLYGGDGNDELYGDANDDTLYGGKGDDYLYDMAGANTLYGGEDNDTIRGSGRLVGGSGDDTLTGASSGSHVLEGGTGNDILRATDYYWDEEGDDLSGGEGNDILYGSYGDDTYRFNLGDEKDVIIETEFLESGSYYNVNASEDILVFGDEIVKDDLAWSRNGDDLVISHKNGLDEVRIEKWFFEYSNNPDLFKVNQFEFTDGTLLNMQDVVDLVNNPSNNNNSDNNGSDNNGGNNNSGTNNPNGEFDEVIIGQETADSQLVGTNGKDNILGLGGDDSLFGLGQNDVLEGGEGNDFLAGGDGRGMNTGDDTLIGGAGNDTLTGGDGKDTYIGGIGNDHFIYNANGGTKIIDDQGGGTDILFLKDFALESLSFYRQGDDLIILPENDVSQKIEVVNHFIDDNNVLEYIGYKGTDIVAFVNDLTRNIADYPGDDAINGGQPGEGDNPGNDNPGGSSNPTGDANGWQGDDTVIGTANDDLLVGGQGNDTLEGQAGDDFLIGGVGDDIYIFDGLGNDVILDSDGTNRVVFSENISLNDVASGLLKSDNDLILNIATTGSQLRVTNFFDTANTIASLNFADGNQITASQLFNAFSVSEPINSQSSGVLRFATESDVNLIGSNESEVLIGNGDDNVILGKAGNDLLFGGKGNDAYIIESGHDIVRIIDREGVNALGFSEDSGVNGSNFFGMLLKTNNADELYINTGGGQVIIEDFFSLANTISTFSFADGSQFTAEQIINAYGETVPSQESEIILPDSRNEEEALNSFDASVGLMKQTDLLINALSSLPQEADNEDMSVISDRRDPFMIIGGNFSGL